MKRKLIFSLALAGLCLWLALRSIRIEYVVAAFGGVRWGLVLVLFPLFFFIHLARAWRWQILARPVKTVPLWDLFAMNTVGFLAISVFPLRLGELIRPLLLKRRHNIPFATGVATIAVERVLDALATSLLLVLGFLFAPIGRYRIPGLHIEVHQMAYAVFGVLLAVLAFLIFAVLKRGRAETLLHKGTGFLPQKWRAKFMRMVGHLFEGLRALHDWKSFSLLFLSSVLVWLPLVWGYGLVNLAFGLHLHASAPIVVMGIAAVGIMVPGAPASIGTFQLFVQEALALYGVSRSVGFAYSVVLQMGNLGYLLAVGLPLLPAMSTNVGELYRDASETSRTASDESV